MKIIQGKAFNPLIDFPVRNFVLRRFGEQLVFISKCKHVFLSVLLHLFSKKGNSFLNYLS